MGTEIGGTGFSNEQATRYMANVAAEARTLDSWHASGRLAETDYVGGCEDAALHLDHFPSKPVSTNDINLFHTVALVKVPDATFFHFGEGPADLQLDPIIDHMNFRELDAGTGFGRVAEGSGMPLVARDEQGNDVTSQYFDIRDGELRIIRRTSRRC